MANLVSIVTLIFAGVAAFIAFQNFRLAGHKRVAEFKQEWLIDFRNHLAQLFMELDKFDRELDKDKIAFEVQYLDLMLDIREDHHKELKNSIMPLAVLVASGSSEGLSAGFDKLGKSSQKFMQIEQDMIKNTIRRSWI